MTTISYWLELWRAWTQASTNRRIFGATLTVGFFTLLARLGSVARDLAMAAWFGTGAAVDAFLIAFLLPSVLINVVSGSFSAAFIPAYVRVREREGLEAAKRLLSSVVIWNAGLLFLATFLLALFGPWVLPWIGGGFDAVKLALAQKLLFILLPVIVISGLSTTWGAVLNAGERFALAAMAPMATPLLAVAFLILMGKTWGIFALAVGTAAGFVLEAGLLGWGLKRQGFPLFPHWHGGTPALQQVMSQFVPMVAGAGLMSSTGLVDQSMAALLGPGSVATLNYGGKVVSMILSLAAMALGTAAIPYFSALIAQNNWAGVRHTFHRYLRLIFAATIPLTVALFLSSPLLVRLLFQRGAFTAHDSLMVAQVQAFYALQIPFYMAGILVVRLISSLQMNRILLWASAINLLINIFLNFLFMRWLGIAGIALSTAVVYFVSFVFCWTLMKVQSARHGVG